MVNSIEVDRLIRQYEQCESHRWEFGNKVLYEMCAEHPLHNNPETIVGKLWLIGRSYAAAIERRKTNDNVSNDDFYYGIVAPAMLRIGKELDERIAALNAYDHVTEENIDEMLVTHKFLMDSFNSVTKLDKRSLSSKYLHFHCPHMVYIYDSRASVQARRLVSKDTNRLDRHLTTAVDAEYADISIRILTLQDHVRDVTGRIYTPRDLDNILLDE